MGNICRSPLAAGILRQILSQTTNKQKLFVDSAGTHDYNIGSPADERACAVARRHGIDLSDHRARQIQISDFFHYDIILAADTATLKLLDHHCPAALRTKLCLLLAFAPQLALNDIPDPYHGDTAAFERCYALIAAGVSGLSAALQDHSTAHDFRQNF